MGQFSLGRQSDLLISFPEEPAPLPSSTTWPRLTHNTSAFSPCSNLIYLDSDVEAYVRGLLAAHGLPGELFDVRVHADCGGYAAAECGIPATVFIDRAADVGGAGELYEALVERATVDSALAGGVLFQSEDDTVVLNRFADTLHANAASLTTVGVARVGWCCCTCVC